MEPTMEMVLPPTPLSPLFPLPPSTASPSVPISPQSPTFDPSIYPPLPDFQTSDDNTNTSNDDLFPDTSHPLDQPTDPALIPLPPSPRHSHRTLTPERHYGDVPKKPKGWISTLSRSSDTVSSSLPSIPSMPPLLPSVPSASNRPGGGRRVSARLPSGPTPLVVAGRTVSGAIQHAIRPLSPEAGHHSDTHPENPESSSSREPNSDNVAITGSIHTGEMNPDTPSEIGDEEGEDEAEREEYLPFGSEEIRASSLGLTSQSDDEIWMQYVRDQIGALFPDFFNPTSTPSESSQITTQPDEHRLGWRRGIVDLDDISGDDTSGAMGGDGVEEGVVEGVGGREGTDVRGEMIQNGRYRQLGGYHGGTVIPNVRDEIGGLREEIERLRGVVGGLAEGLSGYTSAGGNRQASRQRMTTEDDQVDPDALKQSRDEGPGVTEKDIAEMDILSCPAEGVSHQKEEILGMDDDVDPSAGEEGSSSTDGSSGDKSPPELTKQSTKGLPKGFIENASLVVDLIRSLHLAFVPSLAPPRPPSTSSSANPNNLADAVDVDDAIVDDKEIFSATNLILLNERLNGARW